MNGKPEDTLQLFPVDLKINPVNIDTAAIMALLKQQLEKDLFNISKFAQQSSRFDVSKFAGGCATVTTMTYDPPSLFSLQENCPVAEMPGTQGFTMKR